MSYNKDMKHLIGGDFMLVANNNDYEILDNNQQDEYNIVLKASNGDKIALEYIITKYKNFVKAKAKSYFLVGADKEDIIQEGMIGLYKAVRDFDGSKKIGRASCRERV